MNYDEEELMEFLSKEFDSVNFGNELELYVTD
jgi:hypothetical protein